MTWTDPSKHCPECGKNRFDKEYMGGMDTGDVICAGCGAVNHPNALIPDPAARTCKAPGCGRFITSKKAHLITMKKDYVTELKKGFIYCPFCKVKHKAANVVINERSPGSGTYSATFGELATS